MASGKPRSSRSNSSRSSNLSASQRKAIPTSQFGVPSKARTAGAKAQSGNFPMPDKAHARSALRLMHNASPAEQRQIKAKADRILGKSGGSSSSRSSSSRRSGGRR